MNITTRQFQLLTDEAVIWDLMTDNYEPLSVNGAPAPSFEYYATSANFENRYMSSCRLWLDDGKPVGFVYYEDCTDNINFILRRGYESLADEMADYAVNHMHGKDKTLTFTDGQTALMRAAEKLGYSEVGTDTDNTFDFSKGSLDHPLPKGYHFIKPEDIEPEKLTKCLWRGFVSGEYPEDADFETMDDDEPLKELYLAVYGNTISPPPHSTYEHNIVIADENGEYACFSGMWWVEKNRLAYMEPLCTVPEHRRKGLAAAALSEHHRRMRSLGARYMTGGGNTFYKRIGYNTETVWHRWKKISTIQ
ncbi:MAG: GNAT family N-acetyltransferase [Oscillospiraceae bacterium]|nr:GNAT family N-acetyltransferase [Oscillospiraceae bacterium]